MTVESKAAFARRLGVSKQAVSDYVKRKKVDGAALVTQGKATLIDVEKAIAQLRKRLDPDQRISGNARANLRPPAAPAKPFPEDVWELIRAWPEQMAWTVAERGGTAEQAFDAYECACWDFGCDAREIYGADLPGPFDPVNWLALGEYYGLAIDIQHLTEDRNKYHGFVS
jgi:hypothetical protein